VADLVVVDSLARARTLQDLTRGRPVRILACPGELRSLGPGDLGAEETGFEPEWSWSPARQRTLRELRAAADAASRVLLATDPDARGELRAWHLAAALEPRPVLRLWLDALTRECFDEAVLAVQPLDARLIEAELTRRLGFEQVSEALARVVETPAACSWAACLLLHRVAEREAGVAAWRPEPGLRLLARLHSETGRAVEAELTGRVRLAQADAVRAALEPAVWRVSRVHSVRRAAATAPALDLAALALAAERELRFPTARTLEIARRLYEGKSLGEGQSTGLISWHMSAGGTGPTDPAREPDHVAPHLARDECALYGLVRAADRDSHGGAPQVRRETRLAIEAEGWRFEARWPADAGKPALAGVRRGVTLALEELRTVPPEVDPPPRLSEAEVLAELAGIGASSPEDVPPLIARLEEAGLLVRRGVLLHPTRQGQRLLERIGAVQPELLDARRARDFTRDVAGVAVGRHGRVAVLAPFRRWLRGETGPPTPAGVPAIAARRSRAPGLGLRCPECARGAIVERRKRGGKLPFYACDRYPDCRFTSAAMPVAGPCPACGAPLLRARARRVFCVEPGCGYAKRGQGSL
jgi:DNA topoisomerase-1